MGLEKYRGGREKIFILSLYTFALYYFIYFIKSYYLYYDKSNKEKVKHKNIKYNFERKYNKISRLVSLDWVNVLIAFSKF